MKHHWKAPIVLGTVISWLPFLLSQGQLRADYPLYSASAVWKPWALETGKLSSECQRGDFRQAPLISLVDHGVVRTGGDICRVQQD